mmetsp:Transcript_2689/g.6943  ORF Transcript_2689/g.6943 Transcript_2689/m.6943 type:complete len:118 (-) Transcript_2689:323-676(-)
MQVRTLWGTQLAGAGDPGAVVVTIVVGAGVGAAVVVAGAGGGEGIGVGEGAGAPDPSTVMSAQLRNSSPQPSRVELEASEAFDCSRELLPALHPAPQPKPPPQKLPVSQPRAAMRWA